MQCHFILSKIYQGEESIGHSGGGLISHMTYMIYLPVHEVSILVIINVWNNACIDAIKDALIRMVLENLC